MIKVELIGSSGFLGRHISQFLARETGISISNWSRDNNGSILKKFNYENKFLHDKPNILINTAWISNSFSNYQDEEINFEYAHNEIDLIKYCTSHKIRYIGLGTIHEQYLSNNIYFESKKIVEDYFKEKKPNNSLLIRPSCIFSFAEEKPRLLKSFLGSNMDANEFPLTNEFIQLDWIAIEDVCRLVVALALSEKEGIFDIRSNHVMNPRDFLKKIELHFIEFPALDITHDIRSQFDSTYDYPITTSVLG